MQMQMRNFDLELAADEFIGDTTEELTHEFEVGNSSGCNVLGASHTNLDLNTTEAVDSSLEDNSALRKIPNESVHTLTEKYSHTEHEVDGWQNESYSNDGEFFLNELYLIGLAIIKQSTDDCAQDFFYPSHTTFAL